jgi:hypothetical protein
VLLTLTSPYTAESFPVKKEESTMPNHTISTHTKGETTSATVKLNRNDIRPRDWAFLRDWAAKLGVTIEVLLKRILIAGIAGSHYAEKIPEI